MLYDKKWDEKKVEAPAHDPLSLDGLIAWLRTMPADEEYPFCDSFRCLGAAWLSERGVPPTPIGYPVRSFPKWLLDVAKSSPWTYGAALQRALALRNPHAGRAG